MSTAPPIDFYILEAASGQKSWAFACQLIEKAYADNNQVYIHTSSADDAARLDNLLWTFRDDSFLPHNLYNQADDNPPRIQIGFNQIPTQHRDVLINMNHEIPDFYLQFKRVIEIVFSDASVQQLARDRYRRYREQGCEINTYKIKPNEL